MKKLLALILTVFGMSTTQAAEFHEASMNFDMENVKPFLERANKNLKLSLNIEQLIKFTSSVRPESEKSISLQATYLGKPTALTYKVFMDDINAPDLYFFTPSKGLADALNNELVRFADEFGI